MATQTFGTSRVSAKDIFEACLNLRSISVHDYIELPDGKKKAVVNEKETLLAREKQEELKQRFKDWIFSNPVRRDELEELYNDKYNRTVNANYDGSYLQFKGINPNISLYPHQKNAIHRGITDGSALFHHCVGAGKTFTICATAMKLKEYGLAQKPMIVVPNAVIEQFANDFRKLFPNANLLVADKDDMNKANREMFVAKATFCEWDSIIITKSCFDRIGVSKEREAQAIEKDLQKIIEQIEEAKWSSNGKNGLSVKQLEQIRVSKTKLLKELYDGSAKDDMILFEELGVDYLFVDEAHNYKNKSFFTKMSNVAGLNPNGAKSASYLDLKIEYLNELHGGDKGVIFATGTPISNTMAEMWAMQTYLQRNKMERLGLSTFDGWASTFGEVVNSFELKPSGRGYQIKTRFAKFVNMPELMSLYCGIADVQTSEKLKLPVPEAKREIVEIKPSEETISVIDEIAERADKIAGGGVDASVDNMLKITSDGKKVALSARLYDDDIRETGVTKINTCVDKVASIYYETAEQQSTQIIFCDMSTPAPGAFKNYTEESPFNAYCQLKKELIELGIKEEEIQFIHDFEGKAKEKLQQNVKSGNVRILIGSTQKCGTGLNVQDKLIAVHHLDVPWRPSDMEQREGRIIRQGNTNKEVFIYNYVTERTFDAYSYQTLQNKQKFIYQITSGNISVRECEDIDEKALSYGEIKAIASGNPLIKRKVELESELHKLEVLRASYENKMYALKRDLASNLPSKLNIAEKRLENLKADKTIADANATEEFEIIIKGVKCEGRGNEVVATFMEAYNSTPVGQPFANYCGFNVEKAPISDLTSTKRSLYIKGNGLYEIELGESMLGTLTRIENAVNKIGPAIDNVEETIRRIQKDIADAKIEVEKPFAREEELRAMRLELSSINDELNVGNDQVIISEETNSEEVNKKVYRMMPTMEDLTKTYENDLSIDYEQEVFKSVEDEIQKFTDHIINMEKYEIYANASVIVAMNELYFAITNSERFSPSVYRALYEDKGYIMGRIAEQANDWEHTSYATMENTEDLILRYVNEKYKDLMDSYDRAVEMENEISNQIPFIDDVETEKLTIEQEADRWVENQEKQEKLQQFITKAISEIKWLNGKVANFTEDEIADIVNDIKVDFEGSQFDESSEAEPFDLWYDWFIEETLIPELQSRVNEEYLQNETQRIEEKKALLKEATFDSAIKDTSSQEYQDFLKAGGGK